MITKVKPYISNLFRENFVYIIINAALLILIVGFFIYNINKIPENKNRISLLSNEVADLKKKSAILNSASTQNASDLDLNIKILTNLIPNTEDYFSIVYSLEELSRKTNFIINSYNINLTASNENKINMIISGTGSSNSFVEFLKQYNFGGGRLITANKIEMMPRISGETQLSIYLYTKDSKNIENTTLTLDEKAMAKISEIKTKINFTLKDVENDGEETKPTNIDYSKKTNPF